MACSCGGNCMYFCSVGCVDTCYYDCTQMCSSGCGGQCGSNCSGTCSGCDGLCTSCQGCSSCSSACDTGCKNICKGDCNNACLSDNAAATIASLGDNILKKGFIKYDDFITLRNTIHNELARRGKTIPADTFNITPAQGVKVLTSQIKTIFDDCYTMDATKDWRANASIGRFVLTDDIDDSIAYIKLLMSQNVKS